MSLLEFDATPVFERLIEKVSEDGVRIIGNEGGSRSSKTWSHIQFFLLLCYAQSGDKLFLNGKFYRPEKPYTMTISRARMTWLRDTILKDFEEIVNKYDIAITPRINRQRPDQTYYVNGNEIAFIGLDEYEKLHGRKQDFFLLNEAMEAKYEDYRQLAIRTDILFLLDYNPYALEHWIFDKVLNRDDARLIHSTMLDNRFLDKRVIEEIRRSEPTPYNIEQGTADETFWKIYGLGLRAVVSGLIFPNVRQVDEMPEGLKKRGYGLDFGFTNDPTALIDCGVLADEIYLDEVIYETGLTNIKNPKAPNQVSIEQRFEENNVQKYSLITAESAEPKSIKDIKNCGYNIIKVKKTHDSINNGIDILKRYRLNITKRSVNLLREARNYKWQEINGKQINKPVGAFNHGWDAARYWALKNIGKKKRRVH